MFDGEPLWDGSTCGSGSNCCPGLKSQTPTCVRSKRSTVQQWDGPSNGRLQRWGHAVRARLLSCSYPTVCLSETAGSLTPRWIARSLLQCQFWPETGERVHSQILHEGPLRPRAAELVLGHSRYQPPKWQRPEGRNGH